MQKLVWQNSNGDEIDLTSTPYGITQWEGFSNASLNIQSQQVPFQDGSVFLDALIEQRELSVTLAIYDGNDLTKRYQYRRALIHALNPKLGEGYLIYTNDFISKRIKCVAQIPLFETHNSNDAGTPKASLSWTACEPYWEDLVETEVNFSIGELPIIKNEGDVPVQFRVFIKTSNCEDLVLRNITTEKQIKYEEKLNQELLIDTNIGQKNASLLSGKFTTKNVYDTFTGCAYFKDKIVFSSQNMTIVTEDMINFELIPFIRGEYIASNKNKIIVCSYEYIYISDDLIDWKSVTNENFIGQIVYSEKDGCFYGVSFSNIYKSTDGENWTLVVNTEYAIMKLYIVEGDFFIDTGSDIYKLEGNALTQIFHTDYGIVGLVYANGNYTILCSNQCVYSNTTLSISGWTEVQTQLESGFYIGFVYFKYKNLFITFKEDENVYSSANLINWKSIYTPTDSISNIYYFEDTNSLILIGNVIIQTNNLKNWNTYQGTNFRYNIISLNYFFGKVIVCCPYYILKLNDNGWEIMLEETSSQDYKEIIDWTQGRVLLYSKHKIYSSSNGEDWVLEYENNNIFIEKLCVIDNVILIMSSGDLYGLTDFTTLNQLSLSGATKITNNNDYFIAHRPTGQEGAVIYKITKTLSISTLYESNTIYFSYLLYDKNNNLFIGADYNNIYSSTDGSEWGIASNKSFNLLKYSNGVLYGSKNNIFSSVDDVNFVNISEVPLSSITDFVVAGDKVYFSYGSNLIVKESYNKTNVIANLSADSDMGLNLIIGDNRMMLNFKKGYAIAKLMYRQKYIGV